MSDIRVTKLHRTPEGFWRARVSRNGVTVAVTREGGSWTTLPEGSGRRLELRPDVARELQRRVQREERRSRKRDEATPGSLPRRTQPGAASREQVPA